MAKHRRSVEKQAVWRGHLRQQTSSGLSIRQYCRDHGLSEPSFYVWRRELALRDRERTVPTTAKPDGTPGNHSSPAANGLVAVDVIGNSVELQMEIVLADGVVLRLREDVAAETLERILSVVSRQREQAGERTDRATTC